MFYGLIAYATEFDVLHEKWHSNLSVAKCSEVSKYVWNWSYINLFFPLFIAWMSHVTEVKHSSIVARVIYNTCNTVFLTGPSLSSLAQLLSSSCPFKARDFSLCSPFTSSTLSPVSWNHFSVPPKHSLALERMAQSHPSPQHSTPLKHLSTQWAQLPAGRPIDALLWVDCSLLERGGEGWSEWGRPNPTPGHWAWPSRCKHPALLSPWVGS